MLLLELKLLILLMAANGAPILAHKLCGERCAWPVDGGYADRGGKPWFGYAKTWRGIVASLLVTVILAWVMKLPPLAGLIVASGAMLGDLLSSFIKRRLGIAVSGKAMGIDQIPEALLPLLLLTLIMPLQLQQVILLVVLFLVLELLLSRILYHLKIRKKPY